MAKVNFTMAVAEIRNKVGGAVYARNRYGNYARNYVVPIQPNTVYQLSMRAVFAAVSGTWKALSESERQQWREAASSLRRSDIFGNQSSLTGLQYFNKLNIEYYMVSGSVQLVPPVLQPFPRFSGLELSLNVGLLQFTIGLAVNNLTSDYLLNVRCTAAQSQGAVFFKNLYYGIGFIPDATLLPQNMYGEYIVKYVSFVSGTRVGVQVYAINGNTGQRSEALNGYVDVP